MRLGQGHYQYIFQIFCIILLLNTGPENAYFDHNHMNDFLNVLNKCMSGLIVYASFKRCLHRAL
jgi:hypothetical protein